MAQLEPYKDEMEKYGSLVYIAAEKCNGMFHPDKFLREHKISFPFLLDEDRSVTKAYGVYHRLALDAFNIARPATFLVDMHGMCRFQYVGIDQKDRAPIEAVLHILRGLKRPESGKYSAEQ